MDAPITLEPQDVPGAVLPPNKNIQDCSNLELQRWLECRQLKKTGNKAELVQRVLNCIAAGRDHIIFLGIDGGKWYDAKRNITQTSSTSSTSSSTSSLKTWNKFQSQTIPKYFNKGHIYTYIAGLQFDDEDYELHDPNAGTTEKPFRRGSQFVSSDYVYDVYDAKDNKFYYLKAQCYSSFRKNIAYAVEIKLNDMSGAVISGQCVCRQSALERCSHVSALLLFLAKFAEQYGHECLASTSKLREWGLGAKLKSPGSVASKYYPTLRFHPVERAFFEPRTTSYEREKSLNVNNFISYVQCDQEETAVETLLKLCYEDFDLTEEDIQLVIKKVKLFKENVALYMAQYTTKVFQVKGTEIQGSEPWKMWRSYFLTSSNAKIASCLTSVSAKSNYIKKNLWRLTPSYEMIPALYYGRKNEAVARQQYALNNLAATESLVEVGLFVNKEYPHLACSVDGIVMENNQVRRIIEIKCPKMLENEDPCKFKEFVEKKQKGSFYLEEKDGKIKIKDNHPYLYQVAASMLIFEVQECDFIIWSKINMLVFKVKLEDISKRVVNDLLIKLKKTYYTLYVPEIFLMKIPRKLPAYELLYDFE